MSSQEVDSITELGSISFLPREFALFSLPLSLCILLCILFLLLCSHSFIHPHSSRPSSIPEGAAAITLPRIWDHVGMTSTQRERGLAKIACMNLVLIRGGGKFLNRQTSFQHSLFCSFVEEVEYVLRGGFAVVFGIANDPNSLKRDSLRVRTTQLTASRSSKAARSLRRHAAFGFSRSPRRPPPTFTTLHTTEQRSDPFVAPSEAVYLSKDIAVVRPSIVFGKGIRDGWSDGVEEAGKRKPASERATNR